MNGNVNVLIESNQSSDGVLNKDYSECLVVGNVGAVNYRGNHHVIACGVTKVAIFSPRWNMWSVRSRCIRRGDERVQKYFGHSRYFCPRPSTGTRNGLTTHTMALKFPLVFKRLYFKCIDISNVAWDGYAKCLEVCGHQ